MEHYQRLKNIFDVMEEGHLLLEPIENNSGGYTYYIRECNDAFLSIFSLHKDIVMQQPLKTIGVISAENYSKLASLLDDVFTMKEAGKRDVYFCQSLVDSTVVATTNNNYIDVLIYNWSKRDAFESVNELDNLLRVFVARQLCYMELNTQMDVLRLIGDVEKSLHLSRAELMNAKDIFKEIIYYKDYDAFLQRIKNIKERERHTMKLRVLGQHGEKIWVRLDYIKIGHIISTIIENIDHKKQIEIAYEKKKETLREVQKLTSTGNWEWDILTDQYHISEGLMQLLDVAPKEVDSVREIYRDRLTTFSSEMKQSMMGHDHIYEYLKADGNRIWLTDKHQKKCDSYGNVVSIFGITQEVTRDKELYDQIVQLNAEYESIYHSMKAAILVVDVLENGHFNYSNANSEALDLFSVEFDEIIGKSPEQVMGDLGHNLLYHYSNSAKNKESIRVLERLNRYGQDYKIIFLLSPTVVDDRVSKIVVSALESF